VRPSVLCPPATVPESEQDRRVNIDGMVLQMDIDAELDWMSAGLPQQSKELYVCG